MTKGPMFPGPYIPKFWGPMLPGPLESGLMCVEPLIIGWEHGYAPYHWTEYRAPSKNVRERLPEGKLLGLK